MDTITTLADANILGQNTLFHYDASGKVKDEHYIPDAESQEISDEFKRPPY